MKDIEKILVPVDFSASSHEAMHTALLLAHTLGARIEVLHVWSLPSLATADGFLAMPEEPYQRAADSIQVEAREALDHFLADFSIQSLTVASRVEPGRAEDTIVTIAKQQHFDLIVMGTHGRSGLSYLFLGSVAERVVRLAPCPVLTVKAKAKEPDTR